MIEVFLAYDTIIAPILAPCLDPLIIHRQIFMYTHTIASSHLQLINDSLTRE